MICMSHRCNLCGDDCVTQLIDFGAHPIAHHFLTDPTQPEYTHPVTLGFCESCALTQLIDPVPPEKFYTDYHSLSSWKWNPHMLRLAETLQRLPDLTKDPQIFEVGSNDGSFLVALRELGFKKLLGLEPAQDAVTAARKLGIETMRAYFTPAVARELAESYGQCDLFIARQVLEHVTRLPELAEAMRVMLRPGARVLVEVPDFDFNQRAPDYGAIWEEHVNHFTVDTLTRFLNDVGVEVTSIETELFSGQILIAFGRYTGERLAPKLATVAASRAKALAFRDRWPPFRTALHAYLDHELSPGRKIALYGAGCRSCCLVNYAGLGSRLAFAVDDQPEKQGKFMAGSRLAVRPSDALLPEGVSLCLLAVNAENEEKVIARHAEFVRRGGQFVSIHPPSPRLPAFWKQI